MFLKVTIFKFKPWVDPLRGDPEVARAGSSLACKYKSSVEESDIDKHSSLLQQGINDGGKHFFILFMLH